MAILPMPNLKKKEILSILLNYYSNLRIFFVLEFTYKFYVEFSKDLEIYLLDRWQF